MSAETIRTRPEPFRFPTPRKDFQRQLLERFQGNVLLDTPRLHPEGYQEHVQELFRTGEYFPLALGTHKSHAAGFPLMSEAEQIRVLANEVLSPEQQLTGSLCLMASTIEQGQNEEVGGWYKQAKPLFERLHVEPLLVLREKDAREAEKGSREKNRAQQRTRLSRVVAEGKIPLVLPEGTVESGRQKKGGRPGEINGMVPLQPRSVEYIARLIELQGKKPLLFFVGTTGENRIYDPNTEKATADAKRRAVARALPFLRPVVSHIMSSVVDYPVPYEDIMRDLGTNGKLPAGVVEQYCGERLAQLLPPNERGVYANPTMLHLVRGLRTNYAVSNKR